MRVYNIATLLVIVGALNWGLIGALDVNLIKKITGDNESLNRLLYVLVGIAALLVVYKKLSRSRSQ